ncbi:hypothetical protein BSPCLSOX_1826 [uncultured Gammaproteobacteria bacterium]|nr:hypothetical protein BSPCLSOX_1826 [uncultured Gammaproteobacteria bacterium]
MRKSLLMFKKGLVLALLFTSTIQAAQKTYGNFSVTKVLKVYDGDTIRVNLANCSPMLCNNIGIRIYGIDTPEIQGKCPNEKRLAKVARDHLRAVLKSAKIITLKHTLRGKYFRIVGRVFADGIDVADVLIDKQLAFRYFGGKKQSWCQ